MQEHLANYQIGVRIQRGLPKDCCEITIRLNDELGSVQGWNKKVFVCKTKEILTGRVYRPIHKTEVDLAVFEREEHNKKSFEIQLNSLLIKLFKIS